MTTARLGFVATETTFLPILGGTHTVNVNFSLAGIVHTPDTGPEMGGGLALQLTATFETPIDAAQLWVPGDENQAVIDILKVEGAAPQALPGIVRPGGAAAGTIRGRRG